MQERWRYFCSSISYIRSQFCCQYLNPMKRKSIIIKRIFFLIQGLSEKFWWTQWRHVSVFYFYARLHFKWYYVTFLNIITELPFDNYFILFFRYVSRLSVRDTSKHIILGTQQFKPTEFANQINLNMDNAWGILRCIIDTCMKLKQGKYLIMKDPNKVRRKVCLIPDLKLPKMMNLEDVEMVLG